MGVKGGVVEGHSGMLLLASSFHLSPSTSDFGCGKGGREHLAVILPVTLLLYHKWVLFSIIIIIINYNKGGVKLMEGSRGK